MFDRKYKKVLFSPLKKIHTKLSQQLHKIPWYVRLQKTPPFSWHRASIVMIYIGYKNMISRYVPLQKVIRRNEWLFQLDMRVLSDVKCSSILKHSLIIIKFTSGLLWWIFNLFEDDEISKYPHKWNLFSNLK